MLDVGCWLLDVGCAEITNNKYNSYKFKDYLVIGKEETKRVFSRDCSGILFLFFGKKKKIERKAREVSLIEQILIAPKKKSRK